MRFQPHTQIVMRLIHPNLAENTESVADRQKDDVYVWETKDGFDLSLELRGSLCRIMALLGIAPKSLNIKEANTRLLTLAADFLTPKVQCRTLEPTDGWSEGGPPLFYKGRISTIVAIEGEIQEQELIHEFTHHWVAQSFYFLLDGGNTCLNGVECVIAFNEPHGPIFVRAYITILSKHFRIPISDLELGIRLWGLAVAGPQLFNLQSRILGNDFRLNSKESRDLIQQIADTEERAFLASQMRSTGL